MTKHLASTPHPVSSWEDDDTVVPSVGECDCLNCLGREELRLWDLWCTQRRDQGRTQTRLEEVRERIMEVGDQMTDEPKITRSAEDGWRR